MLVYKIINKINQKLYVGYTSKSLQERFKGHLYLAKKNDKRALYCAMRKYGIDNFIIEKLNECKTHKECVKNEIKYIEKYNSYFSGYNMTKGGDGNNGIIMSKESNLLRSKALKGIPKTYNRMLGKKHSQQSKIKISESHKGMKKPWVKWNKEQIIKRSMKQRSLDYNQWIMLKTFRKQGLTIKDCGIKLNINPDVCKKWHNKKWNIF
jgi:group I intron endonuclease